MIQRIILLVTLSILTSCSLFAQELQAYFAFNKYYSPEIGPYIETYLSISGSSVAYKTNENGKMQGNVQVTMILKQGEEIKDFKKYNLASPATIDTVFADFVDMQRFPLSNGVYDLELQMLDLNKTDAEAFTANQPIIIDAPNERVYISDIQLLASYKKSDTQTQFTKAGYELVPLITNYVAPGMNELAFYTEIYGTEKSMGADSKYVVGYYLEVAEKNARLDKFHRLQRQNAKPVNVLLNSFNTENLVTGNYNLVIEVRNKENQVVASKKQFFQCNNPNAQLSMSDMISLDVSNTFASSLDSIDVLAEYISSLRPIATYLERDILDSETMDKDLKLMKQFFYSFWYKREPTDPGGAWEKYKLEVEKVDELFGSRLKKGYATDRGRVYLQYGPPSTVTDRPNEPSALPYQLWHYTHIGQFTNRRFVFYSPNLVASDYELLHSDMRGERNDPKWQMRINGRNTPNNNIDQTDPGNQYGGNATDFFTNPR